MTTRWRGHEHRELYTMINAGPGADASDPQNQYWSGLTKELKEVDDQLNKALGEMKATWEGVASDSANSSTTPLQKWAGDAQTGSSVMHASTVDQAEFVSTARAEMPEPVEVTTPKPSTWQMITAGAAVLTGDGGPAAAVAAQAADHEQQEAAKDAAAQKAVDTMTTYESNSTWNGNTLGTFVPPPSVVVETAPPPGGSTVGGPIGSAAGFGSLPDTREGSTQGSVKTTCDSGGGGYTPPPSPPGDGGGTNSPGNGNGSGAGSVPGHGGGQTDPSWGTPLPPSPPVNFPTPPPPPPTPGPGPGPIWGPPGPYPLPVGALPGDPSGGSSNLSNRPGGPGGPRGVPGGLDGRGGFGAPGGIDGDGGRSAAQLGRGGGAGVGMPGEGVLGRGGAGGAAGARGGAGLGGGPMGAGSGQGDEDDEHFAPDYLLETTDVFGDERMVSPAVIGEDPKTEEK
jgi:PPE family protein